MPYEFTIGQIETMLENTAKQLTDDVLEIKGHTVYFINFDGYFGYSALVFKDGQHIHYADEHACTRRHMNYTNMELREHYVKALNGKLFTDEEIAGPIADYDEYSRKQHFLHNYYGMRRNHLSIFGNFSGKDAEKQYLKKKAEFPYYDCIAFAYFADEAFVKHHMELYDKLEESLMKKMQDKDYWVRAFKYEMYNHEYAINYYQRNYDVLSCFGNVHFIEEDYEVEKYFDQIGFNKTQREAYLEAQFQYYEEQKQMEMAHEKEELASFAE